MELHQTTSRDYLLGVILSQVGIELGTDNLKKKVNVDLIMIDLFAIFTFGGDIVYLNEFRPTSLDILNHLITQQFIEGSKKEFHYGAYSAHYEIDNDEKLVFVAIFATLLKPKNVAELVHDLRKVYYSEKVESNSDESVGRTAPLSDPAKYTAMVELRLKQLESDAQINQPIKVSHAVDTPLDTPVDSPSAIATPEPTPPGTPRSSSVSVEGHKGKRRGGKRKGGAATSLTANSPASAKSKAKANRRWGDDGQAEEDGPDTVLDYSQSAGENTANTASTTAEIDLTSYGMANKQGDFVISELSSELGDVLKSNDSDTSSTASASAGAFSFLRNIIGNKTLTAADMNTAIDKMVDHLMKKNVAKEVAEQISESVRTSLTGSKTQSWTSVESTVKAAMEQTLKRILTPNTSLDLLHEIQNNKKVSKRPYVISVVGVNGVGKSTNLSKIGFWLLQNKLKILVAACDTFRSGAVEQLKVHVDRLSNLSQRLNCGEVEIFAEGYGKDAAVTAAKAIEYGAKHGFDVVLIDTAGRRHNDDRLMSSLEKFGNLAAPDKIIMVGEALVGTDSVQQAKNFNDAFGRNRNLDFFLISKCDTVGDMIGSMVNMTYATGIPVLFVGVGQNYTDLRTLSVKWAVDLLMS